VHKGESGWLRAAVVVAAAAAVVVLNIHLGITFFVAFEIQQ
jgi:hypothetical protein